MDSFVEELRRRYTETKRAVTQLYAERQRLYEQIIAQENLLEHTEALLRAEGEGDLQGAQGPSLFGENGIDWSTLSVPDAVGRLLSEKGRPMHADEIQQELETRGKKISRADPKATVVTALIRGVKRGKFERTGPNTYRLLPTEGGDA